MHSFVRPVLLILIGLLGAASTANALPDKVVKPEPQAVAKAAQFLTLMDRGEYARGFEILPARVRAGGSIVKQNWIATFKGHRASFGRVISRRLSRARFNTTLGGGPDGRYQFLDYKTRFERKAAGLEIVTLTKESGQWEVSGCHFN
jgi:hypothetical protein